MNKAKDLWHLIGPILTILIAITAIWYVSAVWLNSAWAYDKAKRANVTISFSEMVSDTMIQEKPLLPSPHQVIKEIYKTTILKKVTSKRSLVWHGWITLSATLLGFMFGTTLGILLAVGIVFSKSMDMSVMPWVITSQTIPILAIAPMIIVVLNAVGVSGLLPKAIISMYLSFFPVVVGMVKGLRAPDKMQLDQMHTYMERTKGNIILEITFTELNAISVCFIKNWCSCILGGSNSGRASYRGSCRFRCTSTRWKLLWADYSNLECFNMRCYSSCYFGCNNWYY